jgi:hypothetical protein
MDGRAFQTVVKSGMAENLVGRTIVASETQMLTRDGVELVVIVLEDHTVLAGLRIVDQATLDAAEHEALGAT